MAKKSCTIVYIPADDKEELAEWKIDYKPDDETGCVIDRLKAHYAAADAARSPSAEAKAQHLARLRESIKEHAPGQVVTDDLLARISALNFVSSVPLMNNTPRSNFVAVMMYVDDQGSLKGMPSNKRASEICAAVGKPMHVLGDAFIGRYIEDTGDRFERLDFKLSELDMNAPWFKQAQFLNATSGDNTGKAREMIESINKDALCGGGFTTCTKQGRSRCTRCKRMLYCSKECQRRDWKRHKPHCTPIEDTIKKVLSGEATPAAATAELTAASGSGPTPAAAAADGAASSGEATPAAASSSS